MSPSAEPDDDSALQRLLAKSRVLEDAPESLIQRAIGVFESHARAPAALPERRPGLLRRLATLSFDSAGAGGLAFGQRSTAVSVRQLLYTLEGRDIDLRIAADGDEGNFTLSGQVLGPDSAGVVVVEPADGGDACAVTLSDLGEFRLPPVAAGRYRVVLELADRAIELPPVELAAEG